MLFTNPNRRRTCTRPRMDSAIYPRFARWLDFLIVLAAGMWCL
jgi:hypothetical protein